MSNEPAVVIESMSLHFPGRLLLSTVDLSVPEGSCVCLMGPSGSGKTTLLKCIAGLVEPAAGRVSVAGRPITGMSSGKRSSHRLRSMGLVFQFGELLAELSVVENVALPLRLLGHSRSAANEAAMEWLERMNIASLATAFPDTLSGGETQRVAIARAVVHGPRVLLADEPTGALDEANAENISDILIECGKSAGAAVIIATHDSAVAAKADEVYRLSQGNLVLSERIGDR